jgi:hypothetical protein
MSSASVLRSSGKLGPSGLVGWFAVVVGLSVAISPWILLSAYVAGLQQTIP